jgi:FkbM family methyltransferase
MSLIRKIALRLAGENATGMKSYSQSGEDCILWFLSQALNFERPSYIDIGAFDPFHINNTALFYERGCRGINVEPNGARFANFVRSRKEDINLNAAVSDHAGSGTFYEMSQPTLSTILQEEAERLETAGAAKIVSRNPISLLTMEQIIDKHHNGKFPEILCIDTEGLEDMILGQLAQMQSQPAIVCAESVEYAGNKFGRKKTELIEMMRSMNYSVYADTFINTIFLQNQIWK